MYSVERELEREIGRCEDVYRAQQLVVDLMFLEKQVKERKERYENRA